MYIKPPIHTTRETFFDISAWSVSKKGNPYIRDHGHTYTIKKSLVQCDPETCPPDEMPYNEVYHVVAVRFDGERRDFGPYLNIGEMADEIWPDGESSPKGVP
jgi:hypothetical protein